MVKKTLSKYLESTILRIAALVIAIGGGTTAAIALWPSPSIATFTEHVSVEAGKRDTLKQTFRKKYLTVAAAAAENTISRITWQQVLVEDALERAKRRGDHGRVNQLKQQQKQLNIKLRQIRDQMKRRAKGRRR